MSRFDEILFNAFPSDIFVVPFFCERRDDLYTDQNLVNIPTPDEEKEEEAAIFISFRQTQW